MTPELQRRVQRYGWDRASDHYEQYWREQLAPAQRLALEAANLHRGDNVIDVACGTGLVTLPAADAVGPDGFVLATDISGRMVEHTQGGADAADFSWVYAQRMDAESLTVNDADFDVAMCVLGLMYVPDPYAAASEMLRALKPGGRAVNAVWGARKNCGWAEIFPIVDARVNTDVCPLFFQLGTGDSLARTMRNAGFQDVEERRINVDLYYPDEASAIGAAFAGGPVALAYAKFDDETRESAHDEYLQSIEPFRRADGYHIPGEFVVVSGIRP